MNSLGIRSATVLGLSAGGRVALDFAVAYPDRVQGLVLYGAGPPAGFQPMPEGPPPRVLFSRIARAHGLDSLRKVIDAMGVSWIPPERPDLVARLETIWGRYDGRDLLHDSPPSNRVPPARVDQLASIVVPTLVVVGDHEMPFLRVVADTLAARIPGARFEVIENAGHGAHLAQPERFNAVVLDFLARVDRARAARN